MTTAVPTEKDVTRVGVHPREYGRLNLRQWRKQRRCTAFRAIDGRHGSGDDRGLHHAVIVTPRSVM